LQWANIALTINDGASSAEKIASADYFRITLLLAFALFGHRRPWKQERRGLCQAPDTTHQTSASGPKKSYFHLTFTRNEVEDGTSSLFARKHTARKLWVYLSGLLLGTVRRCTGGSRDRELSSFRPNKRCQTSLPCLDLGRGPRTVEGRRGLAVG